MICSKCKTDKPTTEFYTQNSRTGFYPYCKVCAGVMERILRNGYKEVVFKALGDKCVCCDERRKEFLTIDHINGRVNKRETGQALYNKIFTLICKGINVLKDYRILCMNCNFSIGVRGYCPHDKEREEARNLAEAFEKEAA